MKTKIGLLLCFFILLASLCLGSATLAQHQLAASEVKQLSSVPEIVDWLNKTSFSQARIGLEYEGSESYADTSDSMQSMAQSLSRLSEQLYVSPGFTLESLDGCRLTLRNDQVKFLSWGTSSYDVHYASFARFVYEGRKGEKKLTPQTAVLFIPLDRLSYKGGKTPYRDKRLATAKLLGTWRTEFKPKGFFRLSVFEMQITAAEGKDLTSKMTAQKLIFTFDDKQESENFNAAFRRAIQLCTTK